MKHLKRMPLLLTLMSVLSSAGFAGETETPPCVPGETSSPPCTSQSPTDNTSYLSETVTPPVSDSVDIVDLAEAVSWALSLF